MCYKLIHYLLFLTVVCTLLTGFYSCHKDTSSTTTTEAITYTGWNYVGNEIIFSYIISDNSSSAPTNILWDFGDGTTSTIAGPEHIYSNTGTYTVSLTTNDEHLTKSLNIISYPTSSPYTASMTGQRRWKGTGTGLVREIIGLPSTGGDSVVIDTQFSIVVENGGIIMLPVFIGGVTLNLISEDTINKILTFTDSIVSDISLQYYYNTDSMVYTDNWFKTTGGHLSEDLQCIHPDMDINVFFTYVSLLLYKLPYLRTIYSYKVHTQK